MAFKLTYSDGQETDYDDGTAWEVDNGVLKMGREDGEWTVLVSPSHWAVIEVGAATAPRAESGDAAEEAEDSDEAEDGETTEDRDD